MRWSHTGPLRTQYESVHWQCQQLAREGGRECYMDAIEVTGWKTGVSWAVLERRSSCRHLPFSVSGGRLQPACRNSTTSVNTLRSWFSRFCLHTRSRILRHSLRFACSGWRNCCWSCLCSCRSSTVLPFSSVPARSWTVLPFSSVPAKSGTVLPFSSVSVPAKSGAIFTLSVFLTSLKSAYLCLCSWQVWDHLSFGYVSANSGTVLPFLFCSCQLWTCLTFCFCPCQLWGCLIFLLCACHSGNAPAFFSVFTTLWAPHRFALFLPLSWRLINFLFLPLWHRLIFLLCSCQSGSVWTFCSVPATLGSPHLFALFLPLWGCLTFYLCSYYSQGASLCCSVLTTPRAPHPFALLLPVWGVPHLFTLFLSV